MKPSEFKSLIENNMPGRQPRDVPAVDILKTVLAGRKVNANAVTLLQDQLGITLKDVEEIRSIFKDLKDLRLGFSAVPDNEVECITFGDADEDEEEDLAEPDFRLFFSVYPSMKWMKAVAANNDNWLRANFEGRYSPASEEFEGVVEEKGYSLGSSGGGNFDYSKVYGKLEVTFGFWGNPWHI